MASFMCIIVDSSVAAEMFQIPPQTDAIPVIDWIDRRGGKLVCGGRLERELFVIEAARRWIKERLRSGRAISYPEENVSAEEERLRGLCRSNDPHVVALARISGARTLYSRDQDLRGDFRCSSLVANPRGKVYSSSRHVHLLRHSSSCGLSNPKTPHRSRRRSRR
jgi:hypothetical protein